MNGDQPKRSAWQMGLSAGIVVVGVAAVVVALGLTLDHYPVQPPTGNQAGSDRSAAVVAVLTPVVAGIAGIVGLYFGISATGSPRGREAQAAVRVAESAADAAKSTTDAAQATAVRVAQSATDAAKSTTDAAQAAADRVARTQRAGGVPVPPAGASEEGTS